MAGKDPFLAGARYMAFGFEFAGTIVAAVYIGYRCDEYLNTTPWLMLLLTLGGMVGAVTRLLRSVKKHSST